MHPFTLRRATTEDLSQLQKLWQAAQVPAAGLEKRFTEFQVAEASTGQLVGAIGLRIAGAEAWVHSECIPDFSLADSLRPLLWSRVQALAQNHGLFRLWTVEDAPFWKQCEFTPAGPEQLAQLPAAFEPQEKTWLSLQLRDAAASPVSLEREFNQFKEMERQRTERILGQAKFFKGVATFIAIALLLFVVGVGFYLMYVRRMRGR